MVDCVKKCHKNECKCSQNSIYDCKIVLIWHLVFYIITRNISYRKNKLIMITFLWLFYTKFFPNIKECMQEHTKSSRKYLNTIYLFCKCLHLKVIACAIMGVCLRVYESPREWGLGSSVLHSVQRVAADSGRFSTHVDFTSAPAKGWVGETAQRPTPNLLKVIKLEKGYGLMLNWGERPFFWAWARKGHLVKEAKWWRIYSFW